MQREKLLKKSDEEMIQVWVPKKRMKRPFPLLWGLASLGLLFAFAIVTQFQFSQQADDDIFAVEMDAYDNELIAYNVAVKAYEDCLTSIEVRETYREIFDGVETAFNATADLPPNLLPDSEVARQYQEYLRFVVQEEINKPVAEGLQPKQEADCPQVPENKPVKPTK